MRGRQWMSPHGVRDMTGRESSKQTEITSEPKDFGWEALGRFCHDSFPT